MNEIAMTASFMRLSVDQKILASCTGPTPSNRPATIAAKKHPVPVAESQLKSYRAASGRSEEHTSELQSRSDIVCRLLLEKKKELRARNSMASLSSAKTHRRGIGCGKEA